MIALVIAIGDERQLRAGDAAEVRLRLMDLVRHRMRDRARISQRDVVIDAAERHAARAHVEQAHLDLKGVAGALDRTLDDTVGAELAPAIERDGLGRRRLLDGAVGVARNHVELALERQIVK